MLGNMVAKDRGLNTLIIYFPPVPRSWFKARKFIDAEKSVADGCDILNLLNSNQQIKMQPDTLNVKM